jgi:hypothetical protein
MLNAPTLEKLHALKLGAMAAAWNGQHGQVDLTALAFDERFGLLVEAEWRARENKRLTRALQEAKLKLPHACLEAINYPAKRELNKALVRQLATCRWVEEHQNLLVVGATGTGKTFVACVHDRRNTQLVRARPEPGPLSSTGVSQLPRYYGPLRRLPRPPLTGPVPGRPGRATGLPCCQSPRAYVLRPLPRRAERSSRVGVSDRPRRPSSNERRLGARIQSFGACSGFTRVAARTLADPPKADLCPRGSDGPVALAVSRVATKVYRHLLGPDFHRLR